MPRAKSTLFRSILIALGVLTLAALWIWHLRAVPGTDDIPVSPSGNHGTKEEKIESLAVLLKDSRSAVTGSSDKDRSDSTTSSLDWKTGGNGSVKDLCIKLAKDYQIISGKKWGKLEGNVNLQRTWRNHRCDYVLQGVYPAATTTQVSKPSISTIRENEKNYSHVKGRIGQEQVVTLRPTNEPLDTSDMDADKALYNAATKWCNKIKKAYNVKPGYSWGGLQRNAELRAKWNRIDCDVVMRGSFMSCEERNGWDLVKYWRNASQHKYICPQGQEQQKRNVCRRSREGSYQCSMYDLALDFKRVDQLQSFQDNPKLNVGNKGGLVLREPFNADLRDCHVVHSLVTAIYQMTPQR